MLAARYSGEGEEGGSSPQMIAWGAHQDIVYLDRHEAARADIELP